MKDHHLRMSQLLRLLCWVQNRFSDELQLGLPRAAMVHRSTATVQVMHFPELCEKCTSKCDQGQGFDQNLRGLSQQIEMPPLHNIWAKLCTWSESSSCCSLFESSWVSPTPTHVAPALQRYLEISELRTCCMQKIYRGWQNLLQCLCDNIWFMYLLNFGMQIWGIGVPLDPHQTLHDTKYAWFIFLRSSFSPICQHHVKVLPYGDQESNQRQAIRWSDLLKDHAANMWSHMMPCMGRVDSSDECNKAGMQ